MSDQAYNPADYRIHQDFNSPDHDVIILSSKAPGVPGVAFKVKAPHVTWGSYGLAQLLKPFTPVDHWDGTFVYELNETADIVELILRDAHGQTNVLDARAEYEWKFLQDVWIAATAYSQTGLAGAAARRLAVRIKDTTHAEALCIYRKARRGARTEATSVLAAKAFKRACEGSIFSFTAEDLEEMSQRKLLGVMKALLRDVSEMINPVIHTLHATALLLPSGTTITEPGVAEAMGLLQCIQSQLGNVFKANERSDAEQEPQTLAYPVSEAYADSQYTAMDEESQYTTTAEDSQCTSKNDESQRTSTDEEDSQHSNTSTVKQHESPKHEIGDIPVPSFEESETSRNERRWIQYSQ